MDAKIASPAADIELLDLISNYLEHVHAMYHLSLTLCRRRERRRSAMGLIHKHTNLSFSFYWPAVIRLAGASNYLGKWFPDWKFAMLLAILRMMPGRPLRLAIFEVKSTAKDNLKHHNMECAIPAGKRQKREMNFYKFYALKLSF